VSSLSTSESPPQETFDGQEPSPSRNPRWPGLSLPGSWGALLMVCASLTPSLMPRSGVVQGVVGAISAAFGYAVGAGARRCSSAVPTGWPSPAAGTCSRP
jgi:uncharacterized membrane protein